MTSLYYSIRKYLRYFLEALKGGEQDFTEGNLNKAIFLLSIPMIIEMSMESIFAVVDVFFVSKVSVNAVATVGLTESVMMIVYSVAVGLSMAATATVARRIGEKNAQAASVAAVQAVILGLSFALVIGLAGAFYAREILQMMGGSPELIAEGYGYTRWIFLGNVSLMLIFLINAIFRGAGDASIAMWALLLANTINCVLDPLFIFGFGPIPAMGVEGAAIATTTGRSIGVVFQVYHLFKGSSRIKITIQSLVVKWDILVNMIKVSVGGVGQFLIESASWIFLMRVMSLFGESALAGYTISFRVLVFTLMPSWGLANAAGTLVGQNLGALKPDRAETSVWRTALINVIFLGIVGAVFLIFAEEVIAIFTPDEAVVSFGKQSLQVICLGYVFFAYGMVLIQAFNGAGDTKTPSVINIFVFWIFQIPFAYWLAVTMEWGPSGVFWAIAVAHSLLAIIGVIIFKRGRWKTVQV
ncbi:MULTISPECIES: MATE family efflux transporter [unclassified Imperialibacter]|uniref:MATE family efflux transporter n=1 Tax=unclassified Imperialibacter TaxID=2629706 RepID=UPI00125B5804|nr:MULTISPECIES: MATE family efflux transporter [unclassified Imperialibacter]CAD5278783.1 putative MATE family efflux protein [Imperialibacter sp. 89]CAD5292921.1 putative MATE family efflux protein [Imperialibacter sp. 75]VVS99315.1 Multidrug transporter MatE [Imperialibacter sp. EC-SDR9]